MVGIVLQPNIVNIFSLSLVLPCVLCQGEVLLGIVLPQMYWLILMAVLVHAVKGGDGIPEAVLGNTQ